VRVNTVLPGLVDTPGARSVAEPDDFERFPIEKQMIRVKIQPEDIAHAVAFLLSPAARAITAACLDVNGGMAVGA
jgi:NAD(P)-dependent dehydrogenase (short-subunit alcohol dehydrogenase family)